MSTYAATIIKLQTVLRDVSNWQLRFLKYNKKINSNPLDIAHVRFNSIHYLP